MAFKKFLRFLVISFVSGGVLLGMLTLFGAYYYNAPGPLPEEKTVLFVKGTGFLDIVDQMQDQGVIRHGWMFKPIAVLRGDARKFKAGEYHFTSYITPRLIMEMIAEGRVVVHRLTIAEGLTSQQIKAVLENEKLLDGVVVERLDEGSLLPETYHFTYGDYRQELIIRMREGMRATLAELWARRKPGLPITTPEQAVTLASIVEKETGVPEERGRVAAVFINRLNAGMKLQSDPTVIYGMEKDKGPLGRTLVGSDLTHDSPYNTYKITGLPPGPIANPGRAALEAVLNPPETRDLYFVATGNGGHNFSESLKDHNKNVTQYRKALKKKK